MIFLFDWVNFRFQPLISGAFFHVFPNDDGSQTFCSGLPGNPSSTWDSKKPKDQKSNEKSPEKHSAKKGNNLKDQATGKNIYLFIYYLFVSKKSPTGPTERTPKPEYLITLATYLGVRW